MRDEDDLGYCLDPDEWSADIADLFCACSAVIRSGARVLFGDSDLVVPCEALQGVPQYLPPPAASHPSGEAPVALGTGEAALQRATEMSGAGLTIHRMRPREHELTLRIVVRDQLVRALIEHPEVAWALKEDIARALALRADQAWLHGDADSLGPNGITCGKDPLPDGAGLLETVRAMVASLRGDGCAHFASAGWILDPSTLDALTNVVTVNALATDPAGESLDSLASGQLLAHDGADGGVLLGYPFVVSTAAQGRILFSSDWREAWIGADPGLVTVRVSTDARFQTDETVLRAVAHHDLWVRQPRFFTYAMA